MRPKTTKVLEKLLKLATRKISQLRSVSNFFRNFCRVNGTGLLLGNFSNFSYEISTEF